MTCGGCRHWKQEEPSLGAEYWRAGFGTCQAIVHDSDESHKHEDGYCDPYEPCEWMAQRKAVCVDGSGFYAAVKTREAFGCVLFEAKS